MTSKLAIAALAAPLIAWAWLAMLLTHELGHVVAVPLTGGELAYVNLFPGQIPSTLAGPNPRPAVVLWAGFLSGWLLPLLVAVAVSRWRSMAPFAWGWAGFCWLAGGVYLAFGGLERYADTAQLITLGWPGWLLVPLGLAVAAVGYWRCRRSWPEVAQTRATGRRIVITWLAVAAWVTVQQLLAGQVAVAVQG